MQKWKKILLAFLLLGLGAKSLIIQVQAANFEATVTEIVDEKVTVPAGGEPQTVQTLQLKATSGELKGQDFQLVNGNLPLVNKQKYEVGDKLVIYQEEGTQNFTIADVVRRPSLGWLLLIFVIAAVIVGRWQGVTSLLGLLASFVVIFYLVVPRIAAGANPVVMVIIGCSLIIPVMFLLSHGWNRMTLVAMVATLIAMLLTALLIVYFVNQALLTGMASEEAGFLAAMKPGLIDLRLLLIAGMLFATLGVLDDVTVSQAAVVQELQQTDPDLGFWQLYARASKIGRDHISSMINTLILVYAGASFPLLLLFHDSSEPLGQVLNYEMIAEELVRTLTGSIGLIVAVPLTTFLACVVAVWWPVKPEN